MSELLDAILDERRKGALEYKAYLEKLLDHAAKIGKGESETAYPDWADNGARKALVDFFDGDDELPAKVDHIITTTKPDSWVGDKMKERLVKRAIRAELPDDFDHLDELFELVKARHEYH